MVGMAVWREAKKNGKEKEAEWMGEREWQEGNEEEKMLIVRIVVWRETKRE